MCKLRKVDTYRLYQHLRKVDVFMYRYSHSQLHVPIILLLFVCSVFFICTSISWTHICPKLFVYIIYVDMIINPVKINIHSNKASVLFFTSSNGAYVYSLADLI